MKHLKSFNENLDPKARHKIFLFMKLLKYINTNMAYINEEFNITFEATEKYSTNAGVYHSDHRPNYNLIFTVKDSVNWDNIKDYILPFIENFFNTFEVYVINNSRPLVNTIQIINNDSSNDISYCNLDDLNNLPDDTIVIQFGFTITFDSIEKNLK